MPKRIKILHASPNSQIYGTERHILSIVKYSDKSLFEHWVAAPSKGELNSALDRIGIKNVVAGRQHGYKHKFSGLLQEGVFNLFDLISTERFDIVHTHLNSFPGFIAKLAGTKHIVHTRHGVFWSETELKNINPLSRGFQKTKNSFFDITVALGEYEKRTLIDKFNYDPSKIRTTINGVSVPEIDKVAAFSRKSKKDLFETENLVVGAVGRLEKQKGFEFLIRAVPKVINELPEILFVIIGEGQEKENLMNLAAELGISENIQFLPYQKNIIEYVNRCDIIVSTSRWEGLSYSVQEAMALSKPVIAFTSENVSGVGELVVHNETGYLIKDNYIENLASFIKTLANSESLRINMGKNARLRELTHFPEERTAEDMDKIYMELAGRK